jgi:membrane fusion protein, multidrug efflux system
VTNEQEAFQSAAAPRGPRSFIARHWIALLCIVVFIVLMVVFIRYIHAKQPVAQQPGRGGRAGQNGPVAIAVATAVKGSIDVKIPALGTVTPLATVTVRTQITGVMQKVFFTEGQMVHQGDALAQIDPRPYEAALQQAQGNLKRDQAMLADAKLDLKRYASLVAEDSIAQQQLDTQRALVEQDIGTVESDEGQINTAKVNLVYTHITAPVTGRVGLRQVDPGNYVTPGDTNGIVLVNQLEPITIIFPVPEDNVSPLMKRIHDGATLTVEAFDRTNTTKIADGKVLTVDNSIDVTTGTVKLRAQFENADGGLFPNQFVNIALLQDVQKDQVIMPSSAVRRGAPNGVATTFVYVVDTGKQTVAVRPVTLGVVDGERVAVTAGLSAGEVVVTEGGDRLRDGAAIQLPKTQAEGAAANPANPDKPAAPATPGQHRHPRGKQPQ